MKILLVDDESSQRNLLKGFLTNQGYDVLTAGDGEEASAVASAFYGAVVDRVVTVSTPWTCASTAVTTTVR